MENSSETPEIIENNAPQSSDSHTQINSEMENDPVSKKMLFYSKLFAAVSLLLLVILAFQKKDLKNLFPKISDQSETSKSQESIKYTLGLVRAVLQSEQELEMNLSIECTNQSSCDTIKNNRLKALDLIIPLFLNVNSKDLLNPESKQKIRDQIAEKLNSIPLNGKVIQVNFLDLSLQGTTK